MKSNKQISEAFYQAMFNNEGWQDYLANEVSFLGPLASLVEGKEAVVNITTQFLAQKHTGTIKNIIAEEDSICVLTQYQLGHPAVELLEIDACEILKIKDGKVLSMEVFFDSLQVSKFGERMQQLQSQQ